jgi:hypothetical protein
MMSGCAFSDPEIGRRWLQERQKAIAEMKASAISANDILRRAVMAQDAHDELQAVIRDLREENLRRGGDDQSFVQLLTAQMAFMVTALPARKGAA